MPFAGVGGTSVRDSQYLIDNSLRFNGTVDSSYLTRTPSSTTDRQKFTISFWVKRSKVITRENMIFESRPSAGTYFAIAFRNSGSPTPDQLLIQDSSGMNLSFSPLFRDVSAWYHIVVAYDTTQATASNRVKFYLNGTQVTTTNFYTTYPSQNANLNWNVNQITSIGGNFEASTQSPDIYLAEVYNIDGQQLSPTDFGEFDEDSGIWKPIEYTGTYGTNGFYLDFENSGSLGADQSGNGNNFTPTNLASTDQMLDTPTNNFATLNAVDKDGQTNSEGNLKVSGDVVYGMQRGTTGVSSGKWYFEARLNVSQNDTAIALANEIENVYTRFTGETTNSVGYLADGRFFYNSSSTSYSSLAQGDIFQMAFDADTGKIWIGKNNTWQNSGNPASGTGQVQTVSWDFFLPAARTVTTGELIFNFGQEGSFAGTATAQGNTDANGYGDFYYAPPTGFLALCTQNLATVLSPTIDDGSQYFNTVLYTGNGSTQSITGVGFQPDFVWLKDRSFTYSHQLHDSNRGASAGYLASNTTDAENPTYPLTSFDSDGWTTVSGGTPGQNASGDTFVSWQWKANAGSTSSNIDGSIASTVQANTTAGFSIVTYTGTQANATVGHGLGVAPKFIITKCRSAINGWPVYHYSLLATDFVRLNETAATATNSVVWNNTEPTSTVFTVGANDENNKSGANQLAYCFAEIEGYSKFGKYTGNGSSDGTFVYTGFKPAFTLIKRTDAAGFSWGIYDNKRPEYNLVDKYLIANQSLAEQSGNNELDLLSNGMKMRSGNGGTNASGGTYIYMAFASNPFVSSTRIPVVAR